MKKTTFYTGHRWSTDELKTLMAMWDNDDDVSLIAETLNCTRAAVQKMVVRLRKDGIPLKRRDRGHVFGVRNKLWTQSDVEYLIRRRAEKATCEEIAVELRRSWIAVNGMIQKLRKESVPVAMYGNGVRRLWDADSLKAFTIRLRNSTEIEAANRGLEPYAK